MLVTVRSTAMAGEWVETVAEGVAYPLWRRVEDIRIARGWNRSELARRAGLRRATIDALRRTSRKPQPDIIAGLAKATGLDLTVASQLAEGADPDTAGGDATVKDAIRNSPVYDEETRALILNLVDSIERAHGYGPPASKEEDAPGSDQPDHANG